MCVCVAERGGDVAWWRGNVCELNAAKKTGHVCRQQINENKVASSSYSGAPAERSASIYTTQGSDLIWETDLHPRTWMARAKEGERCRRRRRRRRRRERKAGRKQGRRGDAGNGGGNRGATTVGETRRKDRMEERQKKEDTPVFTREFTPPSFDFSHRLNGRIE